MVNILRASKLVKTLISIAILLLVITLATPFLVKSELKNQLIEMGAESASIESLYLNIWTGYLKIEGLQASAPNKPTLALSLVETDIRYLDLFEKRLHINFLTLTGLDLAADIGDEIHIGPLLIPASEASEEPASESEPWGWGITQLTLQGLNLQSQYQNQSTSLKIEEAELKLLQNWLPDQNSHLLLKGLLNDSAFAIDTRGTPLAESAGGNVSLNIDKLQLGPIVKPWLPGLDGVLSSDITLNIEAKDKQIQLQQQGNLSLNNFSFQKALMDIQHQSLNWSGTLTTLLDDQLLSQLSTKGGLSIDGFRFKQGEQVISHDSVNWQGNNQLTFADNQPQKIVSDGKLTAKAIAFQQPPMSVNTAAVSWEGNNTLLMNEGAPEEIASQGILAIDNVGFQQEGLALDTESIRWEGSNTVTLAAGVLANLINSGSLSINQANLKQPALQISNQGLNWQGDIATDGSTTVSAKGQLEDQQLALGLDNLKITNQQFAWSGDAEFDIAKAVLTQLSGDANSEKIVMATPSGNELASIAALKLKGLAAKDNNHVAAQTFQLDKIQLKNKQPLIDLEQVAISSLETGAAHTKVGTLAIGKLDTELMLDKEGQPSAWMKWVEQLQGSPSDQSDKKAATPAPAADTKAAPGYDVALGKLTLTQPATIRFSDASVDARDIEIKLNKLEAKDIDTQSTAPGQFAVAANINRFGSLDLGGNYAWMDTAANGDWKGNIKGLELPPFSPYIQRYSGYQMRSGQFSLDTSGTIKADNVDSSNVINMSNIKVKKASEEDTREFDKQMGMPLETALSIITDDDNNVELDIPVNGSLQDPQFGYQSVINIVMGKIAKEGALSYLTASLQPYGALISLGRMALDSANAINLEPVSFPPGSSELDPKALDYMSKITKLLNEKESLRLNICGIAASTDQQPIIAKQLGVPAETLTPEQTVTFTAEVMKPLLTEVAQQRSENVKQHLLNNGVVQERLFSCLPEVDLESDQPRVALGF